MTTSTDLLALSALDLRDRLRSGEISALELTEACLDRIAARDATVRAWVWIDPDQARAQARLLDDHRASGAPLGALHGLPVGLKDVIDTAGIPTQNGCPVDKGRVPEADAYVVARLRAEGAVIMGKTVTTELAYMQARETTNPHNPAHTPGGSSSGSAAAVADGHVPLAVGTQTGGSVIRPASYCGVTGLKPSFGALPRTGVLMQSHTLDTLGVFGRTPLDVALVAEVLFGHDAGDPASRPIAAPRLLNTAQETPPVPPKLAFARPPRWDDADPQLHDAFAALCDSLGDQITEIALPAVFENAASARAQVNFAEIAHYYQRYAEVGFDVLGEPTQQALTDGAEITAAQYLDALATGQAMRDSLTGIFAEYDAILCPAALGPAPEGLTFTGDSIFNGLWTFAGTPAVTIPAFTARNGLPMGAQLVGAPMDDARLLRCAKWLADRIGLTA